MKRRFNTRRTQANAFTKVELLITIAVTVLFFALVIPAETRPRNKAYKTLCNNNLRNLYNATQMYFIDQLHDSNTNSAVLPFLTWTDYRIPIATNLSGTKGPPSPDHSLFACPKDTFYYSLTNNTRISQPLHAQSNYLYTSYAYNAGYTIIPGTNGSFPTTNFHGIAGMKLDSIAHPATTVLLCEFPALAPYSWHDPKRSPVGDSSKFNDAQAMLCFVDGHVAYTKMFYDGKNSAWATNPPANYGYQWSGN